MLAGRPHHRYTFREYLSIEEMSPIKHEFFDGEIYAMAGGTIEHAALAAKLIGTLDNQLGGAPCRVYTSDLRIRVLQTGLATYPSRETGERWARTEARAGGAVNITSIACRIDGDSLYDNALGAGALR